MRDWNSASSYAIKCTQPNFKGRVEFGLEEKYPRSKVMEKLDSNWFNVRENQRDNQET